MNHVKPTVQALLVADQIYQDRMTGKVIVCGIFSKVLILKERTPKSGEEPPSDSGPKLKPHEMPEVKGSPYAYICLVGVRIRTELQLRFTNLNDDEVRFEATAEIEGKNPLELVELIVPLPRLPIDSPGVYALELLLENEVLGSWRIYATLRDEGEQTQ